MQGKRFFLILVVLLLAAISSVTDGMVVEDAESYNESPDVWNVWTDGYFINPDNSAEIYFFSSLGHSGSKSLWVWYDNSSVDYAEVFADMADLEIGSGDWSGMGAEILVLYFYGKETNNAEPMYLALKDGTGRLAVVPYNGNASDIQVESWQEWIIYLEDFNQPVPNNVDLSDVSTIYIGFGDRDNPSAGGSGKVYFDDILLYSYNEAVNAKDPIPADGSVGVGLEVGLHWSSGPLWVVSHDVYFGTNFNDVNNANSSDTTGIYRGSKALGDESYVPIERPLELSKTYYWRIDETNESTEWKGKVWSFKTMQLNPPTLDGNLQVVDLRDMVGELPTDVVSSTRILWQTQDWEHDQWDNPTWPVGGGDTLGYPTVVKNTKGQNPDNKYYLYYAHHDTMSGIGCAVADSIEGPYIKISPTDSKVLTVPNYDPDHATPGDPSHYSSPCVVWNNNEQLWFMYFHYWNHYHSAWTNSPDYPGYGYQMTALATCSDLSENAWTIWTDPLYVTDSFGIKVSYSDIVPVMPTTAEPWSDSASSYNAIQRLPDGRWLVFLRGTVSATGLTQLGFGTSDDGRDWDYFPENPLIYPGDGGGGGTGVYRPNFIGDLGNGEYLVVWSESMRPRYARTTDFIHFERDPRGYVDWQAHDGFVSVMREGNKLYLFAGKYLHVMEIQVLAGDFYRSGFVDVNDLAIFAIAWQSRQGDDNWNSACDISNPKDNVIDEKDLSVFTDNWLTAK